MNSRKWTQLLAVLIIASILIIGATQKFDTIQAKKVIITSSGGLVFGINGGSLDLNAKQLILDDDADTILSAATDDQAVLTLGAATGYFNIDTGNLKVGDGTPTFTQDGEDAYVEGETELAGELIYGAQTTFVVEASVPITPIGTYQPMTSTALGPTVNDVVTPTSATIGSVLILHNIDDTDAITIDGTGLNVECKADVALFPQDTLTLLWNGTNWICLSNYDNS